MTDTTPAKTYAESRTGKGDKWFQQIQDLKFQADNLAKYAEAHRGFQRMILDGLKSLPMDNHRELARTELVDFCEGRISDARALITKKLAQVTELENKGVTD